MGMVIISFVVLIISLIILVICLSFKDEGGEFLGNFCGLGEIIAGGAIIISACAFIAKGSFVVDSYFEKDLDFQESKNTRQLLTRMLMEDYNATNLSNAIEFNNKQKMIVVENNSFMFRYLTRYYSVDTIQIPDKKFMPTSKVIVEGLEMSPE